MKQEQIQLHFPKNGFSNIQVQSLLMPMPLLIGTLLLSCVLVEGIPHATTQNALNQFQAIPAWSASLRISEGDDFMWKALFFGIGAVILFSGEAMATCPSYPYTLTNGTPADATQVMADFNCAALTSGATIDTPTITGTTLFPGPGTITSSGSVGIGTTSPAALLDIDTSNTTYSPTGNAIARITNTASSGQSPLDFFINGTLRGRLRADYNGDMNYVANGGSHTFFVGGDFGAGNAAMTITSGGAVGIGTSGPTDNLMVSGVLQVDYTGVAPSLASGQGVSLSWNAGGSFSGETDLVNQRGTGPGGFYFFNVAPGNPLGTPIATINSSGTYTPSDRRLKEDISDLPADESLASLAHLRPIIYSLIKDPKAGRQMGFLAQDVQKIFPGLVQNTHAKSDLTPDGMLALNYVGLISPIVKSIQVLDARTDEIQQLMAADAAQAAEISRLETRLSALEKKMPLHTANASLASGSATIQ